MLYRIKSDFAAWVTPFFNYFQLNYLLCLILDDCEIHTYRKIFANVRRQSGQRGVVGVYVCAAAK
ncbi:MAG: hypothetical protein FWH20_10000 [Oscillospiraceae bacterium]|nr:hypothetical protein [Oscillospiraceae bacterium]